MDWYTLTEYAVKLIEIQQKLNEVIKEVDKLYLEDAQLFRQLSEADKYLRKANTLVHYLELKVRKMLLEYA